jgi:ribonuclease HI
MIEYYTDGSASPNPGPGGFAVIRDGAPYICGGEAKSSNIRMEGLAILAALQDADGESCAVTTDSEFWINVLTKWAVNWEQNGWHKKGGIKNLDIVQPLYKLYKVSQAKLIWTRGHVGTELNELADEWANKARKMKLHTPKKISELSEIK